MLKRVFFYLLFLLMYFSNNIYANEQNEQFLFDEELLKLQQQFGSEETLPFTVTPRFNSPILEFNITLKDRAYIYKDSIKVNSDNKNVLYELTLPKSTTHQDLQGTHEVFDQDFKVTVNIFTAKANNTLTLSYQGCDDKGICYPPATESFTLPEDVKQDLNKLQTGLNIQTQTSNEASYINLIKNNLTFALVLSLFFGMLLNLTPCVLPVLPILSIMLSGHKSLSLKQNLKINCAYALGLSCTYMIFGLLLSALGLSLQSFLQSTIVTYAFALLLLILGLSCTDLFELTLPSAFSAKIQTKINTYAKGTMFSAFLFGALSSVLTTPCTSAPLAAVVIYLLQEGNIVKGTLCFFAIGLGMSIPLFIVGVFGINLIKNIGEKTILIKKFIACLLFALSIYTIRAHLGAHSNIIINIATVLITSYFAYTVLTFISEKQNIIFNCLLSLCIALVILIGKTYITNTSIETKNTFTVIENLENLPKGQKIFLNFSAAWCSNCKAMHNNVYNTPEFLDLCKQNKILLYEVDATNLDNLNIKNILQHYQIIGFPTFILLNEKLEVQDKVVGICNLKKITELIEKHE